MNIKGLGLNLNALDFLRKTDKRKTEGAHDRDPGQGTGDGSGQPQKPPLLTDEQIQEAISKLKEIPGVKEANFQFRTVHENGRVILFVEDPTGKIVRRMMDTELWLLLKENQKSKGNLLNKSM